MTVFVCSRPFLPSAALLLAVRHGQLREAGAADQHQVHLALPLNPPRAADSLRFGRCVSRLSRPRILRVESSRASACIGRFFFIVLYFLSHAARLLDRDAAPIANRAASVCAFVQSN